MMGWAGQSCHFRQVGIGPGDEFVRSQTVVPLQIENRRQITDGVEGAGDGHEMVGLRDRVLDSRERTSVVIGAAHDLRAGEFGEVGGEIRVGVGQSLGGFHEAIRLRQPSRFPSRWCTRWDAGDWRRPARARRRQHSWQSRHSRRVTTQQTPTHQQT